MKYEFDEILLLHHRMHALQTVNSSCIAATLRVCNWKLDLAFNGVQQFNIDIEFYCLGAGSVYLPFLDIYWHDEFIFFLFNNCSMAKKMSLECRMLCCKMNRL